MINNEGVIGMLLFNTAPFTVYAHVTVCVCGKFIYPGQIELYVSVPSATRW